MGGGCDPVGEGVQVGVGAGLEQHTDHLGVFQQAGVLALQQLVLEAAVQEEAPARSQAYEQQDGEQKEAERERGAAQGVAFWPGGCLRKR